MRNDNKNEKKIWRLAVRLLEEHLTRVNRAQELMQGGD